MANSALSVYDLTIPVSEETFNYQEWIKPFNEIAKKWVFQLEMGEETGYVHIQARISLHKRKRPCELKKLLTSLGHGFEKAHYSPTSNNGQEQEFYCMKLDTRISGPWTNSDEDVKNPPYIPRQVREIKSLRPYQQSIIDTLDVWDTRTINVLIDRIGNCGKSTLMSICRAYQLARILPPVNDTKDLLRMVCDMPTSKAYMFDMPRAMNKDRLFQFYAAIETIKNGYAYDDRYHFQEKVFDCPNIWIFANKTPDVELLSKDRWRFWTVDPHKHVLLSLAEGSEEELTDVLDKCG